MGEQEVKWDRDVSEPTGNYTFFDRNGNEDYDVQPGFLYMRESYQQL
jgi:hypothetical protein